MKKKIRNLVRKVFNFDNLIYLVLSYVVLSFDKEIREINELVISASLKTVVLIIFITFIITKGMIGKIKK